MTHLIRTNEGLFFWGLTKMIEVKTKVIIIIMILLMTVPHKCTFFASVFSPHFYINTSHDRNLATNSQIAPENFLLEDISTLNGFYPSTFLSSFLGGSSVDYCADVTTDQYGNVYVIGNTVSPDFSAMYTIGPAGSSDCFVVKLNSTLNGIEYTTIIGGSDSDYPTSIEVDMFGNVYVGGWTESFDFPIKNPYQSYIGFFASDGFVFKLNNTGNGLIYSTYIGGLSGDGVADIAIGQSSEVYAVGTTFSSGFPLVNAFDNRYEGSYEGFVLKLNASGNGLGFSSFIGGSEYEQVMTVTLDSSDTVFLSGFTTSMDFPQLDSLDDTYNGGTDCFITQLSSSGDLIYSTFLGGSNLDLGTDIQVSTDGWIYLGGWTHSSDFPTVDPYDNQLDGETDCFILKMNPEGDTIQYSTLIGGSGFDITHGMTIDSYGNVFLIGETNSTDFPIENATQEENGGGTSDGFVLKMNTEGNRILQSTYIGGFGDDDVQSIVLGDNFTIITCGSTWSSDFPIQDALDDSFGGESDGFLVRIPDLSDSDGDNMPDWWEFQYNFDLLVDDSFLDADSDNLTNLREFELGTNPLSADSDMDTIPDNWEVENGFDPLDSVVSIVEAIMYSLPLIVPILLFVATSIVVLFFADLQIEYDLKQKRDKENERDAHDAMEDLLSKPSTEKE